MLFTISKGIPISDKQIAVLSLESGETKILADGTGPRFAASGHLVFGRESSLWAVPFDPDRLTVEGTPAPVVEGVQVNAGGGWALYDFAPDGSLAYLAGQSLFGHLIAVDREGASTPLADEPHAYFQPRFSPDGRRIAVEADDDIWILDVARGTLSQLSVGGAEGPVWTPDGARVTYAATAEGGDRGIFWKPARTEAGRRSSSRASSTHDGSARGPPMARRWYSPYRIRPQDTISGCCRVTGNRNRSLQHPSRNETPSSHRMDGGFSISRTSPAESRSISSRIPVRASAPKCRRQAEPSRAGPVTAARSSTGMAHDAT